MSLAGLDIRIMLVIVMMEDRAETQVLKLRNQGASWGIQAASFHLPLICLSFHFFLEWYMSLLCPSLCIRKILYLRGTVTFILVLWTWVGIYFKVGRCPLTPFIISPGKKCWEKIFSSHYSTGLDHKELRGRIFSCFLVECLKLCAGIISA